MACNSCKQQPQLPSVVTIASHATQAAGRVFSAVISGDGVKCSEEETKRRMAICQFCTEAIPHATKPHYLRCSQCGCWLNGKFFAKASLATEACPLGKWGRHD